MATLSKPWGIKTVRGMRSPNAQAKEMCVPLSFTTPRYARAPGKHFGRPRQACAL